MINILAGYGVSKLERVESIKMFVGGIPVRPEPPLEYNHVFFNGRSFGSLYVSIFNNP